MKKSMILKIIAIFALTISNAYADPSPSTYEGVQKIKSGAILIDVRSAEEFKEGHLNGAINIPHDVIADKITGVSADKGKDIVVYCKSGRRAGVALQSLKSLGYQHVINAGGYEDVKEATLRKSSIH